MPKVMMVGTSEDSGGGISSVIRLIKKMPVWEKYSTYWLGTQVQSGKSKKLWYAVKAAVKAPFIMWRYDIIHFHMVPGITLFIQLPELLIAKLYGKKVITEVHVGNQLVPYANNRFLKWWFKRADLVLLLAKKWEQLFKESYADVKTPTDVLYNACEMAESIPFEKKKKLITFAGTIHDNKAPDLLLKAWAQLKDKYTEWKVVFMGSGEVPRYEQMADELGVSNSVEFTGHIIGERKKQLFHDSSIYCMCSYMEGFPMVVLEAWAHSTAVVTTPVGGLPDAIEECKNCLTFPFGDADALAKQLDRLISDEQLRKEMCGYGYNYAQEHFSLAIISEKADSIYQSLMQKQ